MNRDEKQSTSGSTRPRARRLALRIGAAIAALLVTGCSSSTTIKSDLVLEPSSTAMITLAQTTKAIDLRNASTADVNVRALDRKMRPFTRATLGPGDSLRLDLGPARFVEMTNVDSTTARVAWKLLNNGRIQYELSVAEAGVRE